jgi:hypothetical protein
MMRTAGESWLYSFADHPSFDEGAVKSLQLSKIVGDDPKTNLGSIMTVSGFMGRMLTRYPDRVEEWANAYLEGVERTEQVRRSILWFALALSQLPAAKQLLTDITEISAYDSQERQVATKFFDLDLVQLEPSEEWMLDLLWGCFWGSNDDIYLERIALCVPWILDEGGSSKRRAIGKAAFYALAQNSKHFTSVMVALSSVFERQPGVADAMTEVDDLYHEYDPHTM